MLTLKLTKGDTSITIEKAVLHFPLSTNIERMRRKIINFQTINPGKVTYANPVRYIIADRLNEKKTKNETAQTDENTPADTIQPRSDNYLSTDDKIEQELIVAIQKEINSVKQFSDVQFELIDDIDEK